MSIDLAHPGHGLPLAELALIDPDERQAAEECRRCIDANLPLPAYDQAIKASHIFNTLQARGVISVAERAAYIGRVRDLAKGACAAWMEKNGWAA